MKIIFSRVRDFWAPQNVYIIIGILVHDLNTTRQRVHKRTPRALATGYYNTSRTKLHKTRVNNNNDYDDDDDDYDNILIIVAAAAAHINDAPEGTRLVGRSGRRYPQNWSRVKKKNFFSTLISRSSRELYTQDIELSVRIIEKAKVPWTRSVLPFLLPPSPQISPYFSTT